MVEQTAKTLTGYLRNQVNGYLRMVLIVRESSYDVQYLRDDLRDEYTSETFERVVDFFRFDDPLTNPNLESEPIGERQAVVYCHKNAILIQFPFSETESILVGLSREAGTDLLGFLENCRERVDARR